MIWPDDSLPQPAFKPTRGRLLSSASSLAAAGLTSSLLPPNEEEFPRPSDSDGGPQLVRRWRERR